MTLESLSEWEKEHIHILTSRQMGAWLGRRENRLLDEIRAEIDGAKMPKNRMSFFRDGIDCALQIIDKYKASEGEE